MERLMIATFLVCIVAAGAALAETTATDDAVAADVRQPEHVTVGDAELSGGTWEVYIKAIPAQGTAGTDWDLLTVTAAGTGGTGTLSFTATPENPLTVKLISLDQNGDPGLISGFDRTENYSWKIAEADNPIVWFDNAFVTVDASNFQGSERGTFFLRPSNGRTEVRLALDGNWDCWRISGGSGKVNILNLIGIRNHLNQDPTSPPENQRYDVNEDGAINILDMIVVRNWLGAVCDDGWDHDWLVATPAAGR